MFYFPLIHQILFPSILQLQRENNFQISKFRPPINYFLQGLQIPILHLLLIYFI